MTTLERIVEAISGAYAPAVDARAPYAKQMALKAAHDVLAVLRDPDTTLTDHPSYRSGEWSRRNVEAYVDAIKLKAQT